ncbi:MAG: hypothetical protein WAS33_10270 [Candidatus Promineifilaceae bacterium]
MNTLRTILGEVVSLDELEQALRHYLNLRYGGQSSVFICIDGKTMRGTIPKGYTQGVHLLSAYLAEDGIVLKQVAVESKENEISASGPLLAKWLVPMPCTPNAPFVCRFYPGVAIICCLPKRIRLPS